jgi:hypothetical protein
VEAKPPFSPEEVVEAFAAVLKTYAIRQVTGDKYGGRWPAEVFRRHGVRYVASEQTKSQLYGEALPLLTSRRVELLDQRCLVDQMLGLERRTSWGGRDSIDHGAGGHDDLINAGLGALVLAWGGRRASDRRIELLGEIRVETAGAPRDIPREF